MTSSTFGGVPILMYHEVAATADLGGLAHKTQRSYIVAREDFERQIRCLAEAGFRTISLDLLVDWMSTARELPPKAIVITFDDGYSGNYRHAFPILQQHGFRATFFVVTNKIDDPQMMTWSELKEMCAAGMAVESHTANHPLLSRLDEPRTREELRLSKTTLEDRLGSHVRFLSLPNGDSNPFYVRAAQEGGYLAGCCSRFGFNRRSTDRYYLRRIAVKHNTSIETFRDIVTGRPATLAWLSAAAAAKAAVPALLGKKNYDRLYNLVFGVEEQDKSRAQ